jgi:hypothetical protein
MRARDHITTKVQSFWQLQGGAKCTSLRIYSLGMRNDVKVLFGDIIAEQTGKGTYVVRKGEKMVSPFEYTEIRKLTPKCWALRRVDVVEEDILFASGVWLLRTKYAYVLDNTGQEVDRFLIAAVNRWGIDVFDERGNRLAVIPNYYRLVVLDGEFLVSFASEGPAPQVKVYDLRGNLLAMGPMEKAIQEARRLREILKRLA